MPDAGRILKDNLARVDEALLAACRRSGRAREDVRLVAITKTVSTKIAGLLPGLGVNDLGESRPQELWRKAAALPESIHWHQVGHLQTNKVEPTLPLVHLIHSVDSLRLVHALEKEGSKQERTVDVLLEVNASGEEQKHGFDPATLPAIMPQIAGLRRVRVRGLMTMAAYEQDPDRCRPTFVLMRHLRDRLAGELPPPHSLAELSMGMSNDFGVAVEEGATLIRLGTVLFEGLTSEPA